MFTTRVKTRRKNGGLSIPSMTTSSWFSANWPMPPNIPPGIWLTIFWTTAGNGPVRGGCRSAKSRSRHSRLSTIRSPLGVSAPHGP